MPGTEKTLKQSEITLQVLQCQWCEGNRLTLSFVHNPSSCSMVHLLSSRKRQFLQQFFECDMLNNFCSAFITLLAEYRMTFPKHSAEDYALKENAIVEDLNAFTLRLFAKMDPGASDYQCVYSYSTSTSPFGNGIYLCISPTIEF